MIEAYLGSAIRQTRERAKLLKGKIPHPVKAAELISLQRLCEDRIDVIIGQLDYLLTDGTILLRDLIRERIRIFRRINDEVSQLAACRKLPFEGLFLHQSQFAPARSASCRVRFSITLA
jgi:hypothetical protein